MLIGAILLLGVKTCQLWQQGPWYLPKPAVGKAPSAPEELQKTAPPVRLAEVKNIIENNLFDPERGAGGTKEGEGQSSVTQRIRSMVLVGTAILGDSRYAILQEPSGPALPSPMAPASQTGMLRLKLGDTVEGFRLTEIQEKKVVFTKGSVRVDIELDFFRKVEGAKPGPVPAPSVPRPSPGPRILPPAPAPPAAPK